MDFFQIVGLAILVASCYAAGRYGVHSGAKQMAPQIQKVVCARVLPLLEEARTALSHGSRNEVRRSLDEIELYLTEDVKER
jgi:hypothetical protein